MADEPDRERYRRLPPRVRPTGTEHDVTPPPDTPQVRYVSALSPAGGVRGYEQLADYLTSAPRRSGRRVAALVILGAVVVVVVLSQLL